MQLNYNSTETDHSYIGRIFLFAKRNIWLFILDLIILLFLVLPPYSWQESELILLFLLLLLIRDTFIFIKAYMHIGRFEARGNNVHIGILKGSKIKTEMVEWLPDLDLEIRYSLGFPILYILKENNVLYKQYAFGDWTSDKMHEFLDSFYEYKKEQNLWKIYKGQE